MATVHDTPSDLLLDFSASAPLQLPPDAPAWAADHLRHGKPLAYLQGIARGMQGMPAALREACALFPPGSLARCLCGAAGCPRYLLLRGLHTHAPLETLTLEDIHVDVVVSPDAETLCKAADLRGLDVVACPAGLTPDLVRAWFAGVS